MITYELVKALKDAGFPLKRGGCHECYEGRVPIRGDGKTLYAPTLSELIDACGEMPFIEVYPNHFHALIKKSTYWIADNCNKGDGFDLQGKRLEIEGSTPEESVAKLWLKLNEK